MSSSTFWSVYLCYSSGFVKLITVCYRKQKICSLRLFVTFSTSSQTVSSTLCYSADVYNKIDSISLEQVDKIARSPQSLVISCEMELKWDLTTISLPIGNYVYPILLAWTIWYPESGKSFVWSRYTLRNVVLIQISMILFVYIQGRPSRWALLDAYIVAALLNTI